MKRKRKRGGASVPCLRCQRPTKVLETRRQGELVYRRRQCAKGHEVWTCEAYSVKPARDRNLDG